jgi:alkaline phosphatase D
MPHLTALARSTTRIASCALVVASLALATDPVAAKLVLMHGFADYTSALLWIQADSPGPIEVRWRVDGDAAEHTATLRADAANDNVVVARLDGLGPGRDARYRVRAGDDVREGALRAHAYWSKADDAPTLTLAFGSCFFLADTDPTWGDSDYGGGFEIFDAIADKRPDMMLWLGDNLYFQRPDFLDPLALAARYKRQRAFEPLQRLLTATAHVAIWDDHDYGPNDADSSYTMKGETLGLFRRYWANPSYGLPETAGIFGYAHLGDIDLFLLDDRYHRSGNRAKDGPYKTMFGRAQLAWLKNALLHSRAPVKIVANGNQLWNRVNRFEGWNNYATEQKAFADWLVANRINGVLFLSGDRHFGELLRIERAGAYPLYEFTSSPLTSKPWDEPEAVERENRDVVPGTLVSKRQFGLLRIAGRGDDRTLSLETYDAKGALQWRHEIRARDLRFPREPR